MRGRKGWGRELRWLVRGRVIRSGFFSWRVVVEGRGRWCRVRLIVVVGFGRLLSGCE
jgi:hypothetical protein